MDRFTTSDFPTAITLAVLKHELVEVDKKNPRRAEFVFKNTPRLKDHLAKLQDGQLKVDPLQFWYSQKRLKQILYNETPL